MIDGLARSPLRILAPDAASSNARAAAALWPTIAATAVTFSSLVARKRDLIVDGDGHGGQHQRDGRAGDAEADQLACGWTRRQGGSPAATARLVRDLGGVREQEGAETHRAQGGRAGIDRKTDPAVGEGERDHAAGAAKLGQARHGDDLAGPDPLEHEPEVALLRFADKEHVHARRASLSHCSRLTAIVRPATFLPRAIVSSASATASSATMPTTIGADADGNSCGDHSTNRANVMTTAASSCSTVCCPGRAGDAAAGAGKGDEHPGDGQDATTPDTALSCSGCAPSEHPVDAEDDVGAGGIDPDPCVR